MDILEIPIELQTRIFITPNNDVLVVNAYESFIIKIIDDLTVIWRTCFSLTSLPSICYKECQNWGYDEIQTFVLSRQLLEE
jgi:hypothetical protein